MSIFAVTRKFAVIEMDYGKKYPTAQDKINRIKELESCLAVAAHGPAVLALREENARLQLLADNMKTKAAKATGRLGGLKRHSNSQFEKITQLRTELIDAKAEINRLHGELVKMDTPIDFTVGGDKMVYMQ